MLKNLFSRIKSEKQSTIKSSEKNQSDGLEISKTQNSYQMETQQKEKIGLFLSNQANSDQTIVRGNIPKVRYWMNSQIPDIFSQILSCPISHYNMLPHSRRKVKQIDLMKDKFPQYLEFMKPLLEQQLPKYNHILINHYPKGIGIMHHFDGPMYRNKVVVLSLGGPAIISFQSGYAKQIQSLKILLEDKSVHIFQQAAYEKYLHGIEDKKIDSFTFTIIRSDKNILDPNSLNIKINNKNDENSNSQLKQEYLISQSSINNLEKLPSIRSLIQEHLTQLVFCSSQTSQPKMCLQFHQNQGTHKIKGCFIYIKESSNEKTQNEKTSKWRWKMQIQRQQRISITIRQKYHQT